MNLISATIYRFLQLTVWITYAIYFRRKVFLNAERLKEKGPLLVISNHPNTLMDPLMALYKMPQICSLLVNYSLFKNPITNFILSNLYCIPIQRISDVPEGKPLQNDDAFKKCDEHLLNNGNIYIAVEGTSYPERHIRELKTGMARIAFSAENKTNFELDLRILPIVLTYFEPLKFRKDVVVEVGEPISVDTWRERYAENPRKAISEFTDSIEGVMRNMTIHCKNREEDEFLKKLEAILQSENPLDTLQHYHRSKNLLAHLHQWENTNAIQYQEFTLKVNTYFKSLKALKANDTNLENVKKEIPLSISTLLIMFPLFLIGFINNFIPAWLSNQMIHWLKIDKAYDTTIRYVAGLVFFPILWWAQYDLISLLSKIHINGWFYAFVSLITGFIAYWYYQKWVKISDYYKVKNAKNKAELSQLRTEIINAIVIS